MSLPMPSFVPREESFSSRLRSPAVAARVGLWLGICFGIAFVTGVLSHVAQDPTPWFPWPTRPSWGYRVTQAMHVVCGTAAIPLLIVKLWSVYPKLFADNPIKPIGAAVRNLLERGSIAVLVAAGIFELVTGLSDTAQWYWWSFSFRSTHYAVGWIAAGALVVHIAVKLPIIRDALGSPIEEETHDRANVGSSSSGLNRRGLVTWSLVAAGAAALSPLGAAVPALRKVAPFPVRSGNGPGGIPINRTASMAGVVPAALADDFRLTISSATKTVELSREDLLAMPQHSAELPIACVEGWSASGRWEGVRVRDLLDLVDAPAGSDVGVFSMQTRYANAASHLPGSFADDPLTLLALRLGGETLSIDHGYPCRIIAPNRPGVLQTKWVSSLVVSA